MQFKFITSDARDSKRKRPHGACEACKKRKKRCYHGQGRDDESTLDEDGLGQSATTTGDTAQTSMSPALETSPGTFSPQQTLLPGAATIAELDHVPPKASRPVLSARASRFVGDTHAETNLEVEQDDPSERRDRQGVGMWYDSADSDAASQPSNDEAAAAAVADQGSILADPDRRALLAIFLARVQPILPILEASDTDVSHAVKLPETLALAACLVAAKDVRATPHLRLRGAPCAVPVDAFARALHGVIVDRLASWRRFDRLDLVRILTLVSTHQQGPGGAEEASLHLSQAVHHAFTLGIHLSRASGDVQLQADNGRLFWCLWSLDKLSAAINGRPRMAYEMDVGLDFDVSMGLFGAPARLWMRLARLLSSVHDLYNPRPFVDTESHVKDFPRWEFLLEEEKGITAVDEGLLTTLELFYHAVSMLSCRIKLLVGRKRASASSQRRDLSAATVYAISKCVPPQDLAPLPVVPYTYCLATLVAYQQYRCSKRHVHRAIAAEKLAHFQEQLQDLSPCWHAARSMSRKTRRVLGEFRRRQQETRGAVPDGAALPGAGSSAVLSSVSDVGGQGGSGAVDGLILPAPAGGVYGGGGAFADMDLTFGNLMDMNAFTEDIDFAWDGGFVDMAPLAWAPPGEAGAGAQAEAQSEASALALASAPASVRAAGG